MSNWISFLEQKPQEDFNGACILFTSPGWAGVFAGVYYDGGGIWLFTNDNDGRVEWNGEPPKLWQYCAWPPLKTSWHPNPLIMTFQSRFEKAIQKYWKPGWINVTGWHNILSEDTQSISRYITVQSEFCSYSEPFPVTLMLDNEKITDKEIEYMALMFMERFNKRYDEEGDELMRSIRVENTERSIQRQIRQKGSNNLSACLGKFADPSLCVSE